MNDATKTIITNLIADEVVKPLLGKARKYAQPVLDLLPDDVVPDAIKAAVIEKATKALSTFVVTEIVKAIELLFKRGVIDVTTEGRIVFQVHEGAHPDDR